METNLARRKDLAAVETLGALLVDIPVEDILATPAKDFAKAPLAVSGDNLKDSSPEERLDLIPRVIEHYEEVHVSVAHM